MAKKICERLRKMAYTRNSHYLLNNYTLDIRDPEIRRNFEQIKINRFNSLFLPVTILCVLCLCVSALAKLTQPQIQHHFMYWQGEGVFFCFLWWLLRKFKPGWAPILLVFYFLVDHVLYTLAFLKLATWYIPEEDLRLYATRLIYNIFILMLLNYNSFKLSIVLFPTIFMVPQYFEELWFANDGGNQEELEIEVVIGKMLYMFTLIFIAIAHTYLVQRDLALVTLEKTMIAR